MWVLQKLGGLNSCRWSASDPDKNTSLEKERTTQASTATKATLQLTFQNKDGQLKSAIAPVKCEDSWIHSSVETRRSSKRVARISILPITSEEAEDSGSNHCLELRSCKSKMRTNDDDVGNRPTAVGCPLRRSPLVRRVHRAVTKCRKLKCKCCRSICPQVILILANFIFLVCGWGLIVSGVWLYLYQDTLIYSHLLSSNEAMKGQSRSTLSFNQIPLLLITSGVFVASVSFLGCCGACSESVCFLGFYSILLLFVICAEILLALVTTQVMDHISLSTSEAMIEQLRNTYNKTADQLNNTSPEVAKVTWAWDHVQSKVKCCGVFGPRDYIKTSWFNHTDENDGNFVPLSCCMVRDFRGDDDDDDGSTRVNGQSDGTDDDDGDVEVKIRNYCQIESLLLSVSSNQTKNIHTQGCHDVFARWIDAHVGQFRCILVILITIQVLSSTTSEVKEIMRCDDVISNDMHDFTSAIIRHDHDFIVEIMVDFISAWCLLAHLKRKQSEYWWCDEDDDDY